MRIITALLLILLAAPWAQARTGSQPLPTISPAAATVQMAGAWFYAKGIEDRKSPDARVGAALFEVARAIIDGVQLEDELRRGQLLDGTSQPLPAELHPMVLSSWLARAKRWQASLGSLRCDCAEVVELAHRELERLIQFLDR